MANFEKRNAYVLRGKIVNSLNVRASKMAVDTADSWLQCSYMHN